MKPSVYSAALTLSTNYHFTTMRRGWVQDTRLHQQGEAERPDQHPDDQYPVPESVLCLIGSSEWN